MIKQIKVISTSLDSLGRRVVKFLRMGLDDVQEVETVGPFGFESNPIKDMIAIHGTTGVSGESKVIGFINKDCITNVGESRMFSTDADGNLQTFIHLKNNGIMHVGGDSDFMMRFNNTKSVIDEIQSDIANLKDVFSTWVTVPNDGGAALKAAAAAWFATPLTEDIDPSKIDEIKTL